MSAYADEQEKLDESLVDEVRTWKRIKQVLDEEGFDIKLSLSDGLPHMSLEKTIE